MSKSIYDKIWESAIRTLSARMVSRSELSRKLEKKFPDEDGDISKILDEMERVELLNDKRYTENLINHLTQKPIGRLKIFNEARRRGLDRDALEIALMNSDYNEEEMLQKAIDEKIGKIREEDPRKKKQKLMNFLLNRGFTSRVIYSGVKDL